jgi:hypothetical protein
MGIAAKRGRDRLSHDTDGFVYTHAYSEQGPDFAVPHRIIKRTKTRIYVDRQIEYNGAAELRDKYPENLRCFTLDREAFERDGCATGKIHGYPRTFYATEERALIQR